VLIRLTYPGLVELYDTGAHGRAYLVMRLHKARHWLTDCKQRRYVWPRSLHWGLSWLTPWPTSTPKG
jgi:hypothetical protein